MEKDLVRLVDSHSIKIMPNILGPLNQFSQEFLLQEIDDLMIGQERLTNKENIDRIYRILDFNTFFYYY